MPLVSYLRHLPCREQRGTLLFAKALAWLVLQGKFVIFARLDRLRKRSLGFFYDLQCPKKCL